MLYLSSVLVNNQKEKTALCHLVVKKLLEEPQYNNTMKNWGPAGAPWITAKVCTAAYDIEIPKREKEKFIFAVQGLIESYDEGNHNWICTVGSHMDTSALCIEAILSYYNQFDHEYKEKAKSVFHDILSTYVLDDNIYETISLHPLGKNALDKLNSDCYVMNEPYQKRCLAVLLFFRVVKNNNIF